jgi:hypothetical protein
LQAGFTKPVLKVDFKLLCCFLLLGDGFGTDYKKQNILAPAEWLKLLQKASNMLYL